jgi:hypothetical protein
MPGTGWVIYVPEFHMPIAVSLGVIGGVLAICVVLSLLIRRKVPNEEGRLLEPVRLHPPEPSDDSKS